MAVRPYATACGDLRDLARSGARAWLDPSTASAALFAAAEAGAAARAGAAFARAKKARGNVGYESKEGAEAAAAEEAVLRAPSPVALAKALKNDAELAGMHACHARDGAAVVRFLSWLQGAVDAGEALDECSVADVLEGFRAKDPLFRSLSFDTIAGAGPNGAIIHYRAEPSSCRGLRAGELFLLDSGAQYEDGTTDVTRTVQLGSGAADPFHSACFTAVLKGNIALDSAIFPEGTPGFALDSFARQALWRAGLDYRHGTGHGVGAALNVHEGPQSISPRWGNTTPLQSGMVLSNEPGYYGASARKSPPSPPAHMRSSTRLPTLTVRACAHTHTQRTGALASASRICSWSARRRRSTISAARPTWASSASRTSPFRRRSSTWPCSRPRRPTGWTLTTPTCTHSSRRCSRTTRRTRARWPS